MKVLEHTNSFKAWSCSDFMISGRPWKRGGRDGIFGNMNSEDIDHISSVETFEKVKTGLEGSVGELVLVVKPEVTGWYRGWTRSEDFTSRVSSLGVLADVPSGDSSLGNDVMHDILLPVERYVHGFSDFKRGPISFNCVNPDDVGVSDSEILNNKVSIYVGTRAIENVADAMGYFKSMNILGESVSDEFYSDHECAIEKRRESFLNMVKRKTIESFSSPDVLNRDGWRDFYVSALGWGVEDRTLDFDGIGPVVVGKILRAKL